MTLTELFAHLGAPLANQRWSWGSVRSSDGAVFLRVWQDECDTVDGMRLVRITDNKYFSEHPDSLGYAERLKHIELIRSGNRCFMIMCVAKDTAAHPRVIAKFDEREVFAGGRVLDHANEVWLERKERLPIAQART